MAVTVDSISIVGLRVTHFKQLREYLEYQAENYWYTGNRKYFDARHDELEQWLNNVIETLEQEGTVIPKR